MAPNPGALEFPWDAAPEVGKVREIAPGLLWARLPLPFALDHINIWLLREADGWTVVDTGCATYAAIETWEALLSGPMRGLAVRRVVATHGHVDHVGLSGWLTERFGAKFLSTFAEWGDARMNLTPHMPGSDATHLSHLIRHGFEEAAAARLVAGRNGFIKLATPIPGKIIEIRNSDILRLGGRDWRVIVSGGHAVAHAAFHDAVAGVMIAGDQLLPNISPAIGVFETMPDGDPLEDYLCSFEQFADIPETTLILPSHGLPYRGIRLRIEDLRAHHRERLKEALAHLSKPRSALELSRSLFPDVDGTINALLAVAETLAHVNYLVGKGRVRRIIDSSGRVLFVADGDRSGIVA